MIDEQPTISVPDVIEITGARVHNLKNVSVKIPHGKLVVITGLSGSGKSSLAFDTLYAEGQRRYVESLSSYARQFMGKIDKPEVDRIVGIAPAIAIDQKVNTRNPRSTVGTSTEIYDYIKLLYARIGRTYSPISGNEVKKHTASTITKELLKFDEGTKLMLFAPLGKFKSEEMGLRISTLQNQGNDRVRLNGEVQRLDEIDAKSEFKDSELEVMIDRLVMRKEDDDLETRIVDAVDNCLKEGHDQCLVLVDTGAGFDPHSFSTRFEADGMEFELPSADLFSFNNPYGACKRCEGFGSVIGIDPDLVIPDRAKSVYEEGIVCWKGESMGKWREELIMNASKFDFPIHRPIYELMAKEYKLLWTGNTHFRGLNAFFKMVEEKSYKIQYRVMLSRYRGKTDCPECDGTRLRKDANYVKIGGKSISELLLIPIERLIPFFNELDLNKTEHEVAKRLMAEIKSRLGYLDDVGLGFLTLNRLSNTLSGGESQRINLASSLGSSLVGSMYILDEPSIGLHSRDTERLISILERLRDLGNTVIVVEHDEDIMDAADLIIDMGPEAGTLGGEVVFTGTRKEIDKDGSTLTAKYLSGEMEIPIPEKRRPGKGVIHVLGAREHNLKNVNVSFPLNAMSVITGVSGSGKSTIVRNILHPALKRHLGGFGGKTGQFERLDGQLDSITDVEFVDQNPIGRSSRSNPVTYIKAYDEIRALYSDLPVSKGHGFKPKHFSFNVAGGRCDVCEGEGVVRIEMQFMADIVMKCDNCDGKRFKSDVLEAEFQGKSIADVLDMTVDEAIAFFGKFEPKVAKKLQPLQDVGLGYVSLGQSSNTLSGGEAQRIKLAYFLAKGKSAGKTMFIFDEPTTGLHFHDINKLLASFYALLDRGHTIVLIEHHPDVIKCADHLIDLGPEGGDRGGELLFEGTPEELMSVKGSYTATALKGKLKAKA